MSSERGAKVLAEVVHVDVSGRQARLIDALKAREFDVAAKLVNEDHVGVNARDDDGVPALSIAVPATTRAGSFAAERGGSSASKSTPHRVHRFAFRRRLQRPERRQSC